MNEQERVLDFLTRTAAAIAETFGSSCETLVHDMAQPGHPLIAIYNSHVSGRQIGSTADIFGGDLGAENVQVYIQDDAINTLAITNTGRYIKSTTIHYKGKGFHYALGINYDYTRLLPALDVMQDLTQTAAELGEQISSQRRLQLDDEFEECVRNIGKPIVNMKKQDRIQLITLLMNRQFFELQKSVTYVSERLGISRYTVYKYIHEVEDNLHA